MHNENCMHQFSRGAVCRAFNLTALPNDFLELLRWSDLKISGVSVGGEIVKIGRDFKYDHTTKNLKYTENLGSFERKRKAASNGVANLKKNSQWYFKRKLEHKW